jgi:putative transcriptional regulator
MTYKKRFRTRASEAIHTSASALYSMGVIDEERMREYDASCLVEPHEIRPWDVKRIRESQGVTQPVFARYLNTSVSTIQKWESGAKRPSGMAVRLLEVVKRHGLKALDPRESLEEPAPPTQEPKASAPPEQSKVA